MDRCDLCQPDCVNRFGSSHCSLCARQACHHATSNCVTADGMTLSPTGYACSECDATYQWRSLANDCCYQSDEPESYWCPRCDTEYSSERSANRCCENRPRTVDPGDLHDYSYKPAPLFRVSRNRIVQVGATRGRTFMGVELEYNESDDYTRGCRFDILQTADREEHRYYMKEDSSVSGGELVTHPGTFRAWRDGSVIDWETWAQWKDETGAQVSRNTGFHIHINRTTFTGVQHLYRFHQLLLLNPAPWQSIGRRDSSQWGIFQREDARPYPAYPIVKGLGYPSRYRAVNLCGDATIELRFPMSTRDRGTILATLGIVAAAVEHTRNRKHGKKPTYEWSGLLADTVIPNRELYADVLPYLRRRELHNPALAPRPVSGDAHDYTMPITYLMGGN